MSIVLCSKCDSVNGVLCRACGRPNHFEHTKRGWTGDRYDACWRTLRRSRDRFKTCDGHEAPVCECDNCRTRVPALAPQHQWRWPRDAAGWKRVNGLSGNTELLLCPTCHGTFRVGLDWSMERNGESLQVSIACAFAFQLGQVSQSVEFGSYLAEACTRLMGSDWAPEFGRRPMHEVEF